jgi:hypothetical protein
MIIEFRNEFYDKMIVFGGKRFSYDQIEQLAPHGQ